MINVTVNDVSLALPDGASLADALAEKSIEPNGIATALNGKLVPAVRRSETELHDGDKIVIIKAFYGG